MRHKLVSCLKDMLYLGLIIWLITGMVLMLIGRIKLGVILVATQFVALIAMAVIDVALDHAGMNVEIFEDDEMTEVFAEDDK